LNIEHFFSNFQNHWPPSSLNGQLSMMIGQSLLSSPLSSPLKQSILLNIQSISVFSSVWHTS
jgi:hypothetical protein